LVCAIDATGSIKALEIRNAAKKRFIVNQHFAPTQQGMKLPRGERSFGTAFFADLRFSNK
jgi:hypothetical protein